jgi:hypothetical protein
MPAASERSVLEYRSGTGWWIAAWRRFGVLAGLTDRRTPPERLLARLDPLACVDAGQTHGAVVAAIGPAACATATIPGCDGLITRAARVALMIRSADCLPLFFLDPGRRGVGLAHVGWRGLARRLPQRLLLALRDVYGCRPARVRVAIGPSIRACCYEVGQEVAALFAPHVRAVRGRRVCDLVAAATEQLRACGVPASQLLDSGACTSCEAERWFSHRREGPGTGRMLSVIMVGA